MRGLYSFYCDKIAQFRIKNIIMVLADKVYKKQSTISDYRINISNILNNFLSKNYPILFKFI
jgi:hypothetical protein